MKRWREKMKRLSLIVFVVVLMTSSAFAATADFNNGSGDGLWSTAINWNPIGVPVDTGLTADYVKIQTTMVCTLNSAAGDFGFNKVTVAGTTASGGSTLNITGGSIGIGNEMQDSDAGKTGTVVQTGGTVSTFFGSTAGKLEIGYKAAGVGNWTISGGSIGFKPGYAKQGQIIVGGAGAAGAVGTFTVIGHSATIDTNNLLVGTKDTAGAYPGTGTLAFQLDGSVSPINVALGKVIIDPTNAAACVANLVVSLLDNDVPPPVIVLVKNGGSSAVLGKFDTLNGGAAGEGATVVLTTPGLTSYTYKLTYLYNADAGALANDIALVPEPATLALLGLGALVVRRPRRK